MSLKLFIGAINEHLTGLLTKWPGAKAYGLCQSVDEGEKTFPAEVDDKGEGKYVGVDDNSPIILYHKCDDVKSNTVTKGGYGEQSFQSNTYNLKLIVYFDRRRVNLSPDELMLYIQSNFPDNLKSQPYISNYVRFAGVILNTKAVFNDEYKGIEFSIPLHCSMFQIGYTIESKFVKNCFAKCPC